MIVRGILLGLGAVAAVIVWLVRAQPNAPTPVLRVDATNPVPAHIHHQAVQLLDQLEKTHAWNATINEKPSNNS